MAYAKPRLAASFERLARSWWALAAEIEMMDYQRGNGAPGRETSSKREAGGQRETTQ